MQSEMELEWNPLCAPKPGHETEFLTLFKLLRSLRTIATEAVDRSGLDRRWNEIQVNPYETIKAPRVGTDAVADKWIAARYAAWQSPSQSETDFIREMQGFYVLQLVSPCDGFPYYSNGGCGNVERFSFRAQLLSNCEEILGRTTLKQIYRSCLGSVLQGLGEDMQALAAHFADKRGIAHVESVARSDFEEGSAEQKVHIVFSAAKWCKFWSDRGHGLAANWQADNE